MIDFTTIQTFPIPLDIKTLQDKISVLKNENKVLNDIIIAIAVGLIAYFGYQTYKYFNKNKPEKSNFTTTEKET